MDSCTCKLSETSLGILWKDSLQVPMLNLFIYQSLLLKAYIRHVLCLYIILTVLQDSTKSITIFLFSLSIAGLNIKTKYVYTCIRQILI